MASNADECTIHETGTTRLRAVFPKPGRVVAGGSITVCWMA